MPVAEIEYVALKPLLLQTTEGERLSLVPGDLIPSTLHGRWINTAIEANKVAPLPVQSADVLTDAELKAELESRGYRVTRRKEQ